MRLDLPLRCSRALALGLVLALASSADAAGDWVLVGWNNLGMHCMDPDYSVFALLPPYNTIYAQLIGADGTLVRDPGAMGIAVTYEAAADPDGSINSSSAGKTNFWEHAPDLFGVSLAPDAGLAGSAMPGAQNQPQPMRFEAATATFVAEGIPITPRDDAGHFNSYPLMRLVARNGGGDVLATTDIVLPVSDELNCHACHASASSPFAMPFEGWVFDPDRERDTRLNILRLHDERESFRDEFTQALRDLGYDAGGLFPTAMNGKAVLCAACHLSEALPGSGRSGISSLTQAVHRRMAFVFDPLTGGPLDLESNRSACYRCHPGSVTRCLRGAMGSAVAPDGTLAMQCQSCHGHMLDVASTERTGWLDEPNCQSCHTGTAVTNSGQIRYTSAFDDDGLPRLPADTTYATNPDTPAPGLSLYRFSIGHGGLACEACHGATHAEYPSAQRNDNLQSVDIQGHEGMLAECRACHGDAQLDAFGGPHGMHPVGQEWVERHGDLAEEGNVARCRNCHGADLRGTVLSRAKADRDLETDFGNKHFWRGFQVGCFTCHLGPNGETANPNRAPVARDARGATNGAAAVDIALAVDDADGDPLQSRIVRQPLHGTAGLDGTRARYFPERHFFGPDSFSYAANDGSTDSNLATVIVDVTPLAGDANCDGRLSAADISAIIARIGSEQADVCDTDVDDSGETDLADVATLGGQLFQ